MVDNAVYSEGRRVATPESAAESREELAAGEDRLAWLGLYRPEPHELGELAELYDLPELAVEDAIKAHQRPKFERYGNTLFVVLKAARYLDATEEVEFGELHLFLGADFAITVRHSESPDLSRVRRRLESEPALLAKGSEAVLYAMLDAVVDGYRPVVDGLANDIDEIETEVFRGDPGVSRRIYELSQEVLEFQRAAAPLTGILAAITAGFDKYGVDEELRGYLRDVADHVTQVNERAEGVPAAAARHPDRQRDAGRPAAERGDPRAHRGVDRPGRGGQEDLRLGGHPLRAHPGRHRLRDELRRMPESTGPWATRSPCC